MPPPITAQVATVRHKTSVPAKFQIASRQATTATRMHALVVQKDILMTIRGFRKPLLNFFLWLQGSDLFAVLLRCYRGDR